MKNTFKHAASTWVRYSEYEWKTAADGSLHLTPASNAKPSIYDPLKDTQQIVLDALNIGQMGLRREPQEKMQEAISSFAAKYGLLGLMTALPTTPRFMDYEAVYLPKNQYIKEESLRTQDYLAFFFPFDKLDLHKQGVDSVWNLSGDRTMIALALTMRDRPTAVNMCFQRGYAERYDWLVQQFKNWAFVFITSNIYYSEYDRHTEDERALYRQGMEAFDGISPTYYITLLDKPTIVWNFDSLLLGIQMMFSFMLTDDEKLLQMCRHCTKIFIAGRSNAQFCSPQCKNRYNVYKSRAKKKDEDRKEY